MAATSAFFFAGLFGGMVMPLKFLVTFGLMAAVLTATAQAQQTGDVRIQVNGHREVHGGGADAKAAVTSVDRGESRLVDLGANGRADVSGLPEGTYMVQVGSGDRMGITYVRVEGGKASTAELSAQGLPKASTFAGQPDGLVQAASAAALSCDRAAYDAAVTELDRDLAMVEINVRDINRILDEYGRLTNLPPDQQRLQGIFDAIARRGMQGRSTPGNTARTAGAPVETGMVHLPAYLAAVKEKARLDARLAAIRAARQKVPPYPQNCAREAAKTGQLFGLQMLLGGELALVFANRPQFAPFRLELGGIISKLGAFKPDDTDAGTQIGVSSGIRWDSSFLGTKQLGLEAKFWYVDYKYSDSGDVVAEPGGTIGIFSPTSPTAPLGGYAIGPFSGPLSNGWYDAKVRSYGAEVQVQTWLEAGNLRVMPWIGMRVGRTTIDENMSFDIGTPVFTSFEQHNDIKDTYVGPTIGLRARVEFGGGVYGFTEGSLALEYHRAKGDWQTSIPLADPEPRKDNLSSSKWGVSAGVKVGLGWQFGRNVGLEAAAGISYTNASPYLEYKDADSTTDGSGGADIGYGSQTELFGSIRTTFRF